MKDNLKNEEAQRNFTPPPYLVSYAVTKKCNLKCKHCYSDAGEDWERAFRTNL
jgi:MoaA/NifB/PqqE/SkfB family radical SAM enzyme